MIQKSNGSNRFNVVKLKKAALEYLGTHFCKCGHTYLEHPACYWKEKPDDSPIKEKIGYLDIECSNMHAPFGYVLSWCIMDHDTEVITGMHVDEEDFKKERNSELRTKIKMDERILKGFCKEAKKYDKLVVYYGKNRRHDIPFLRHRCIKLRLDFPLYGEVLCVDMYDWVKNYLKMPFGGNSLWSACTEFGIKAKGTRCPRYYWPKAGTGNMKAVKVIYAHNQDDVVCLKPLYEYLEPFSRRVRTSA